jgi:hypothetical protein
MESSETMAPSESGLEPRSCFESPVLSQLMQSPSIASFVRSNIHVQHPSCLCPGYISLAIAYKLSGLDLEADIMYQLSSLCKSSPLLMRVRKCLIT